MTATEQLIVRFPDGSPTRLTAHPAPPGSPVVLVLPALGGRASYYAALMTLLADRSHTAVLAGWRGHGGNSVRPWRSTRFGYAELLRVELPGITDAVCARFAVERVAVLGHSLGGHTDRYVPGRAARYLAGELPTAPVTSLEFDPARVGPTRADQFRVGAAARCRRGRCRGVAERERAPLMVTVTRLPRTRVGTGT